MEYYNKDSDLSDLEEFAGHTKPKAITAFQATKPFELLQSDGSKANGRPGDFIVEVQVAIANSGPPFPARFVIAADRIEELYDLDTRNEDQKMKDFLADPKVKENASRLAVQMGELTSYSWFTPERIIKKSAESFDSVMSKLATLVLLDFAVREMRDGEAKYKVVSSPKQKAEVLRRQLEELYATAKEFEADIQRLDPQPDLAVAE